MVMQVKSSALFLGTCSCHGPWDRSLWVPVTETAAKGVRARVRAELTEEIKSTARAHLASDGAAALSLRAVAREVGMASSAVYRYFPSREALLTALIVDAYDTVGARVEDAHAGCEHDDFAQRWLSIGTTVRAWALENPHEYALIYGSPVPGYAAPEDTIAPATRVPIVMLQLLADVAARDSSVVRETEPLPDQLVIELTAMADTVGAPIPPAVVAQGLAAWAEMLGLISLELFGHLENVVYERDAFFELSLRSTAARMFT